MDIKDSDEFIFRKGIRSLILQRKEVCEKIATFEYVISTCANNPYVVFSSLTKHIGVVHDLQGVKLEWKRNNKIKAIWHFLKNGLKLRQLTGIITISNSTKKEIKLFCGREAHVIYYALESPTSELIMPSQFRFSSSTKYILDVNTFYEYKNADSLIRAFNNIKQEFPNVYLYFKGNDCEEFDRLPKLVELLGLEDRVYFDTNSLTNEEMSWLYHNALLFVSPSKMEGFGATPIEAIIHGVQTLVSDIPTHKEVIPNFCASFFDPCSIDDLQRKIFFALKKPISKEKLEERSVFLLSKYSREKQVNNYIDYLKKMEI